MRIKKIFDLMETEAKKEKGIWLQRKNVFKRKVEKNKKYSKKAQIKRNKKKRGSIDVLLNHFFDNQNKKKAL